MRPFTRTLANNAVTKIAVRGDTIYVQESSANLAFTTRKTQGGGASGTEQATNVSLPLKATLKTSTEFDEITVRNVSGGSIDFTILAGFGEVDEPPTAIAVQGSNALVSAADVTAGVAATLISAANASRKRIHVQALFSNTQNVRVGDANITATRGVQLVPGMGFTFDTTAALYCIYEAAGTVQIAHVQEDRV